MLNIAKKRISEILQNSIYTEKGWTFNDVTPEELNQIYKYYREAILDGDMPTTCIAGIRLDIKNLNVSCFEAIPSLKETFLEVVKNLNKVVFPIIDEAVAISIPPQAGKIQASQFAFKVEDQKIKPFASPYICTALLPYRFDLFLIPNTGNRTASENFEQMNNQFYIPLATSHTLWRYIKIIKIEGNTIVHRIDPSIDIQYLYNAIFNYIVRPVVKVTEEVNDININRWLSAIRVNSNGKYTKSFNAIVNHFNASYSNPDTRSVKDFVRLFKGVNRVDTLLKLCSIKNVSADAATYFYEEHFKEVLE